MTVCQQSSSPSSARKQRTSKEWRHLAGEHLKSPGIPVRVDLDSLGSAWLAKDKGECVLCSLRREHTITQGHGLGRTLEPDPSHY
jgi:hypothetical protein